MTNILQIELKQYIDNHNFETALQDTGVILFIPVYFIGFSGKPAPTQVRGYEAHYVETYRQARCAIGY